MTRIYLTISITYVAALYRKNSLAKCNFSEGRGFESRISGMGYNGKPPTLSSGGAPICHKWFQLLYQGLLKITVFKTKFWRLNGVVIVHEVLQIFRQIWESEGISLKNLHNSIWKLLYLQLGKLLYLRRSICEILGKSMLSISDNLQSSKIFA